MAKNDNGDCHLFEHSAAAFPITQAFLGFLKTTITRRSANAERPCEHTVS